MITTRILSCTAVLAGFAFAATAFAEDKKSSPPNGKPGPAAGTPGAGAAKMGAPAPSGPPMPTPSKELGAFMKGFEGAWRCDTKFVAGAMGPGSPEMTTRSTVKIKKEFGGFSWHGDYSLSKSKTMPAMSGIFQVGYDPGSNQATIVGYDSMGTAAMGVGAMSGESVTFVEDGYMMGMKMKMRETMTKKSPKEIYHTYEVDMGKGFQPMGDDTCRVGHAAATPPAGAAPSK